MFRVLNLALFVKQKTLAPIFILLCGFSHSALSFTLFKIQNCLKNKHRICFLNSKHLLETILKLRRTDKIFCLMHVFLFYEIKRHAFRSPTERLFLHRLLKNIQIFNLEQFAEWSHRTCKTLLNFAMYHEIRNSLQITIHKTFNRSKVRSLKFTIDYLLMVQLMKYKRKQQA
jgi:hypothetical protein